jgi:hypothetical protein
VETVKLPGVGTFTTFDRVPADFDPFTADDATLQRYGFPVGKWKNRWGRPKQVIQPGFSVMDYKHFKTPRERLPLNLAGILKKEFDWDWSGAIVYAAAPDTINSVEGIWTVPNSRLPGGAADAIWYTASCWVGIDHGEGSSPDILQMGTDSNIQVVASVTQRQIGAWVEWMPAGAAWIKKSPISNELFPVSIGDKVDALIVVDQGSKTAARMYLHNETQSIATSFGFIAPPLVLAELDDLGARVTAFSSPSLLDPPIQLVGDCAEWIVEALIELPAPTWELANYDIVIFDGAQAGTVGGATLPAALGDTIDMIDANIEVISEGTINNAGQVQCTYVGP